MDIKQFIQRDVKKSTFSLNFEIFGKKRLFESDHKKTRNVEMGYSELVGHSKSLPCCGCAWKYFIHFVLFIYLQDSYIYKYT